MGLLMLGGLVGGILYSSHLLKKDIIAEKDDWTTKPTLNTEENKRKVKGMFLTICRRSGIRTDKYTGNPLDLSQCHKGIEYLQYQGYDKESIDAFKKEFNKRYNQQKEKNRQDIERELTELSLKYQTMLRNGNKYELIIWHNDYYGNMNGERRMKLLRQNPLWRTITKEDSTYIRSRNTAKYTEVWRIVVPQGLLKGVDKQELYNKVCWVEKVDNGSFYKS